MTNLTKSQAIALELTQDLKCVRCKSKSHFKNDFGEIMVVQFMSEMLS
jgi:hypothetical protein